MRAFPFSGAPQEFYEQTVTRSTQVLSASGQCCAASGVLRSNNTSIAVHTDYGPPDQDKDVNQDYIIAWLGPGSARRARPRWAIAMADGVSSSYFAEFGAELACCVAISKLVEGRGAPEKVAQRAVDAAGDAIAVLAERIEAGGRQFRPPGEFESSWEYTLRKGLLLQTTLTLVWMNEDECHFAVVGDAGITIWPRHSPSEAEVLTAPNLKNNLVHALGPNNTRILEWDYFGQSGTDGIGQIVLYTDGIGRMMLGDEASLPSLAKDVLQEEPGKNDAATAVKWMLDAHGDSIDDNMTLATVSLNPA